MAATFYEGQTATHPDGRKVVRKGGRWIPVGDGAAAATGRTLSRTEQTRLNEYATQSAVAGEALERIDQVAEPLKRLKPGPWRGRVLDMAIPEEKGGMMDTIGGVVLGGPLKAIGAISDQDVSDYQKVKAVQAGIVGDIQLEQKGVQTESDAARYALTTLSTNKRSDVNDDIIAEARAKANRQFERGNFASLFANKYGLNGVNEKGQTMIQAFQEYMLANKPKATTKAGGITVERVK